MKKIYIISGKSGSGKGTLSLHLKEKLGGTIYPTSEIIRKIFRVFQISETRESFSKMNEVLLSIFGKDVFARAVQKVIDEFEGDILIFEGVRKMTVVDKICSYGNSTIIFIEAIPEVRYERMLFRGEKTDESIMTYEKFLENEDLSSENELMDIRSICDIVIENNGSEADFFQKIDSLLLR